MLFNPITSSYNAELTDSWVILVPFGTGRLEMGRVV